MYQIPIKYKLLFIVASFFLLKGLPFVLASPCQDEIGSPVDSEEVLEFAIQIEETISTPQMQSPTNYKLVHELYTLQEQTESLLADENISRSHFQNLQNKFKKKIEENFNNKQPQQKNSEKESKKSIHSSNGEASLLEKFIENPSFVEPDTVYVFESSEGKPLSVVFYKQIVNKFFKSFDPQEQQIGRQVLEVLKKRSQGLPSGITILSSLNRGRSNNRFFALHIGRKGFFHNWQFGGFIYEGTMYLTQSDKRRSQDSRFFTALRREFQKFQGEKVDSLRHPNRVSLEQP